MRKLIVTVSDSDMLGLEAIARAEDRAPEEVAQAYLSMLLDAKAKDRILPSSPSKEVVAQDSADDEQDRQRRREAVGYIFGLWKNRDDTPKDAVAYQKAIRAEWK
jgi:hypothetical protein